MSGASSAMPWIFVVGGVVLMALELLAPGAFMIWLGLAGVLTGLWLFVFPLGWEIALVIFAVLAVAFALVGRRLAGGKTSDAGQDGLNERGRALVGRTFRLEEPIAERRGRVRVDDTVWRVEGPDAPAGAQVRVVGVEGTLLRVEPA
jgi:membrane protein implicated in regulation of membrane protease activity